jgi:hypothetical protein
MRASDRAWLSRGTLKLRYWGAAARQERLQSIKWQYQPQEQAMNNSSTLGPPKIFVCRNLAWRPSSCSKLRRRVHGVGETQDGEMDGHTLKETASTGPIWISGKGRFWQQKTSWIHFLTIAMSCQAWRRGERDNKEEVHDKT